MKRNARKLCAVVLMVSMLFSLLPGAAFAAPANGNSGLKQYTSMEELIQDSFDELKAQGKVQKPAMADEALVNAVESKSDMSFNQVKNSIGFGLYSNYADQMIDTSAYNLSAAEMDDLMTWLLNEKQLAKDITYTFNTDHNGIVTAIRYEVSDALGASMKALYEMGKAEKESPFMKGLALQNAQTVTEYKTPVEDDTPVLFGASTMALSGEERTTSSAIDCEASPFVTTGTAVNFDWAPVTYSSEGMTMQYDEATDGIIPLEEVKTSTWQLNKVTYTCPQHPDEIVTLTLHNGVEVMEVSIYADSKTEEQFMVEKIVGMYGNPDEKTTTVYVDQEGNPTENGTLKKIVGYDAYGKPQTEDVTSPVDNSNWMPVMTYAQAVVTVAVRSDDFSTVIEDAVPPYELAQISYLQANEVYERLRALINGKSECFGIPTPFWTNKTVDPTEDSQGNPFGALKVMLNMEESSPDMTGLYAAYLPDMINGFAAMVVQWEEPLLDLANEAYELVNNEDVVGMSDEYKMLLLHDWLANVAVFDMSNLLALSSDGEAEAASETTEEAASDNLNSILGMTPFTLLSSAINYKGGVCLGYTASYAYIVQNAFRDNYYDLKDGATGETMKDYEPKVDADGNPAQTHIVDFVKIMFNADTAECSVAGANSGFTTKRFTQPHFFNAVNLTNPDGENNWYFVDACYDDVNPEVISQYRVETDGNISHMYFLSAPSTLESQFDGKCNYIDSLYDGKVYVQPGSQLCKTILSDGTASYDEENEVYNWKSESTGITLVCKADPSKGYYNDEKTYQAAVEAKEEDNPIEAGWPYYQNSAETAYNDDTYEEAWFGNAQSEIILYGDSWYYVEGQNAYNSMKDFNQGGNIDFGEYGDQLMETMGSQLDDPDSAHQIKRRPVSANDKLEGSSIEIDMNAAGGNAEDSYTKNEDPEAYGLFHYGYGYVNYGKGGINSKELAYAGANDDATEDMEYRKMYPELSHGIGLYDNKLYFNIGNKIMCYDIARDGAGNDIGTVSQVKEYNDVYAKKFEANSGELFFAGGSFMMVNEEQADYTFRYHPIAGLSIHGEYSAENGMVPYMYVAIATNLSESYTDSEGNKYKVEAVNYNPSYQRYLDDGSDDTINDNEEFMWCANVVETMPMDAMSAELAALKDGTATNTAEVTVAAYCEKDEFKETRTNEEFPEYTKDENGRVTGTKRTADFGLSDGSTKVETEDTALNHKYVWSDTEETYICSRCNHCDADYEPPAFTYGDANGDGTVNIKDAARIAQYVAGKNVEIDLQAADANGDGVVNIKDAARIAQYVAGKEVDLG